jgi:hypothetical protein
LFCIVFSKIERIQNPLLFKQYVIRKEEMDRANPGKQNERTLWHGTSADALTSINETGFNRSYFGKNGQCVIGLFSVVHVIYRNSR